MPKRGARSPATDARKRLPPSAPAPGLSVDISVSVAGLFDRVAAILERAQTSVVLSLNSQMVLAYWHIGREIVHLLQGGEDRAEYGKGQMDGYVRLFDDQWTTEGDNPTDGLILCAEKNEAVAKYSVLSENRQIFAAKYVQYLPTEEELRQELQRERRLIEEGSAEEEKR